MGLPRSAKPPETSSFPRFFRRLVVHASVRAPYAAGTSGVAYRCALATPPQINYAVGLTRPPRSFDGCYSFAARQCPAWVTNSSWIKRFPPQPFFAVTPRPPETLRPSDKAEEFPFLLAKEKISKQRYANTNRLTKEIPESFLYDLTLYIRPLPFDPPPRKGFL